MSGSLFVGTPSPRDRSTVTPTIVSGRNESRKRARCRSMCAGFLTSLCGDRCVSKVYRRAGMLLSCVPGFVAWGEVQLRAGPRSFKRNGVGGCDKDTMWER